MIKILNWLKTCREFTIVLGFVTLVFGLALGFNIAGMIGDVTLEVGFYIGLLFMIYGYYCKFYNRLMFLLFKCLAVVSIHIVIMWIRQYVQYDWFEKFSDIVVLGFALWYLGIGDEKIQKEKSA